MANNNNNNGKVADRPGVKNTQNVEKDNKTRSSLRVQSKGNAASSQATLNFQPVKKVSFGNEKEKDAEMLSKISTLEEEVCKLRKEKLEIEKMKVELMNKHIEICERLDKVEEKMECVIEKLDKYVDFQTEMVAARASRGEGSLNEATFSDRRSEVGSSWSVYSGISRASCLSEFEVKKMRRWINEKDKFERMENIIIKGIDLSSKNIKEDIKTIIVDKLGVQVEFELVNVWVKGTVVIVKLGSAEQKQEIMKNKSRLKGTNIFIDNDLSFEDRKKQEEIGKWVRGQRERGKQIKMGLGKVQIEGKWIKWEEICKGNNYTRNNEYEEFIDRSTNSRQEKQDFSKRPR